MEARTGNVATVADSQPSTAKIEKGLEAKEQEEDKDFIEFEFYPSEEYYSPTKERSASPDPVDEVLEHIFEAASQGDTRGVCDLILNKNAGLGSKLDNARPENKSVPRQRSSSSELKRKSPVECDLPAKKQNTGFVDFTNVVNIRQGKITGVEKVEKELPVKPPTDESKKRSLIDYSVLTKALSKTLESKLSESEDSDVKIVIFCNNRPVQSFSVRSNSKKTGGSDIKSPSSGFNIPHTDDKVPSVDINLSSTGLKQSAANEAGIKVNGDIGLSSYVGKLKPSLPSKIKFPLNPTQIVLGPSSHGNFRTLACKINPSSVWPTTVAAPVLTTVRNLGLSNVSDVGSAPRLIFSTLKQPETVSPSTALNLLPKNIIIKKDASGNITFHGTKQPVPKLPLSSEQHGLTRVCETTTLNIGTVNGKESNNENNIATCTKKEESFKGTDICAGILKDLDNKADNNNELEDDGPISCEFCNKTFRLRRYLNRHKIRVHRQVSDIKKLSLNSPTQSFETLHRAGKRSVKVRNFGPDFCADYSDDEIDKLKIDETVVKQEAVDEVETEEDRLMRESSVDSFEENITEYISTILNQNKECLEKSEYADKGKRALFHKTIELKGEKAINILAETGALQKAEPDCPLGQPNKDGVIEPVYVCDQCGKFYRARKTLREHFFREHSKCKDDEPLYLYISGNKYQCPICFNHFHSGSELVSHTQKHTGELHSECRICGKVYSSVHVLRRHIENLHSETRPRPFKCQLCDYAAANKWHLKEHYRRHTGEQPFPCPICNKAFSHQGTMNRHCKIVHKFEVASQRGFTKNNLNDLPVLIGPLNKDGTGAIQEPPDIQAILREADKVREIPTTPKQITVSEAKEQSEVDQATVHDDNSDDVDLSLVKTEPADIDD
ncbi:transcription factor E4F1-like isoform X2 [Mya arenaria]|uniref:transcription factor E4F1-like isoform X2 n=1 Tax=Mya arenaria TaxID=6604 RepID=UPI0022DFC5EC|nr:transcription factor E4F1-like isoform X2 [Mya arenaria]XP_052763386.1 transcription factor E4F1-like isoform X2 [Mya arenaria]